MKSIKDLKISFKIKVMGMYIVLTTILVSLLTVLSINILYKSNDFQMKELGKVIAQSFNNEIDDESETSIQAATLKFYNSNKNVIDIISVVNTENKMIAHSIKERVGQQSSNGELINKVKETKEIVGERSYVKQANKNLFIITFPLIKDGEVKYITNMGIRIDAILDNSDRLLKNQVIICIVSLLVIMLFCNFYLNKVAKSIQTVVDTSNDILKGDFTIRFENDYNIKEINELNNALNKILNHMSTFIGDFKGYSNEVTKGTSNLLNSVVLINEKSNETEKKSSKILGSLENSSAVIEEIYSSIEEINNIANNLNNKAILTNKNASEIKDKTLINKKDSERILKETLLACEKKRDSLAKLVELSKSVDNVLIITRDLDNITRQINLLALNAQIEAANAGIYGKGFAVVANEIRSLSDQTKESLKNIDPVVKEVIEVVNKLGTTSNEVVDFMATKLDENNKMVQTTNDSYLLSSESILQVTNEIKNVSDEVKEAINQISLAINDFAQKTETIFNSTQDMTNNIKSINEKNKVVEENINYNVEKMNELNNKMDKFKY